MTTRKRGVWLSGIEAADVADNLHLATLRMLNLLHITDALDRCAVVNAMIERLEDLKEDNALQAVADGASFADLARAMGVSRQAARQWVRARCSEEPPAPPAPEP
jgi:hypothetical protein